MSTDPVQPEPYGFGALDAGRSRLDTSRFVVLPVPYEQTTTFVGGTRAGPDAILRASREMELWDEDLGAEVADVGIHTRPPLEACATGPGDMVERVRRAVAELVAADKIPVLLGGEHTVSVGAVRAAVERNPDLVTLVLDAHADLRDAYRGSPYSHACSTRRISELCPVVQVGVRSLSAEEAEFLRGRDWALTYAREVRSGKDWIGPLISRLENRPVYLSVDLDVFDPGVMPAVGTPEPGGLSWDDGMALVRALASASRIVAFDLVELSPIPGLIAPDFFAAKLVYKIMGQVAAAR